MIPFTEAYRLALENCHPGDTEITDFFRASGRILAEDIVSDLDMPPFHKSAVDGYACRRADLTSELRVLEIIAAGQQPSKAIGQGECTKIMTGAMIPAGADCVIMVEDAMEVAPGLVRFSKSDTAANICYRGEDVKKNDVVLKKGCRLNPAAVAVLAAAGCIRPAVFKMPSVAIISTGDELVEPGENPPAGKIRNSNAWQLLSQASAIGCTANYEGIARDNEEETLQMIKTASLQHDILLLTGGVSMGDFDFVPAMMEKAGFKLVFKSIAIQPGKPTVMGVSGDKICFGLPGNPVSSYLVFELLVKPCIYKKSGHDYQPLLMKCTLDKDFKRRKTERMAFVPVVVDQNGRAHTVDFHGSAHINAMSVADGIMIVNPGTAEIRAGENVYVRQI